MDCIIRIAKTKALISCAVTAQLICVFVFAYAKNPVFSYRGPYGNPAAADSVLMSLFMSYYGRYDIPHMA